MPNTPLAVLSRVEKVTTAFLAKEFLKTETATVLQSKSANF